MEISGQLNAPAALPQGKEHPVLIKLAAGWAPVSVWTLWTTGNRTRVVQPVARRYIESYRKKYLFHELKPKKSYVFWDINLHKPF